jgi:hypothetical protein
MMEVEGMNMVEKRPSKERPKVEGMDMVEEHPTKEWSEIEGLDMVEDTTAEVIEREHEGVVLVKHWIDDGAERHRQTHRERELAKSGCRGHNMFASSDSNCLTLCRVNKRVQMRENVCEMSSNCVGDGGIYRVMGDKI